MLLDRQLLFVTGKGGVGKTTIAAGLAFLAATHGKRTLVCEVDAKGSLANALEVSDLRFAAREVQRNLFAMAMNTEESLKEYLHLQLRLPPFLGRIGPLARTLDFVASAAPGVREILTVGKLCWEVRERHYDLVVVDAPATGHIVGQLAAPDAINTLVHVGLVREQTRWMADILSDPARTGVAIVVSPEEMPVNEAIDLVGAIRSKTTVEVAAMVINRVLPEPFGRGEEEIFERLRHPDALARLRAAVGPGVDHVVEAAELAVALRRRKAVHLAHLRQSVETDLAMLYVPELFARLDGLRATAHVATALAEELGY